jgi:hypothetical protein
MSSGPPHCAWSLRAVAAAALAATVFAAAPAHAQQATVTPPGNDVVYLKSGGLVRGTLIEAIPGQTARVQLVTGEVSTIPWSEVDHIVTGPTPTPTPTPAPTPTPTPTPSRDSPMVRLHIESPRNLELVGRPEGGDWVPVCGASCDRPVHLDWEYEVRGEGIKASGPFVLGGAKGDAVSISVDPASKGTFIVGIVSIAVGGNVTLGGLVIMLAGSAFGSTTSANPDGTTTSNRDAGNAMVAVGAVATGVGALAVIGGILAVVGNVSTTVKQDGQSAAQNPAVLPTFAAARETPRLPPTFGLPLLSGTF